MASTSRRWRSSRSCCSILNPVQAHVVGVPDQLKGEVVAAVIELRAGTLADTSSILAFCRERLASYKVPVRLDHPLGGRIPARRRAKSTSPGYARSWRLKSRHE